MELDWQSLKKGRESKAGSVPYDVKIVTQFFITDTQVFMEGGTYITNQ